MKRDIKMTKDIYKLREKDHYHGIYNLIAENIDKLEKGKQTIDVHKTNFWSTGGSSFGLYQEPEHHSSSTTIKLVAGKKESLEKYITLLYLTNLDERNYTNIIERCGESFNGNRCHKYINIICNYKKVEPCSTRDNHFYEHLGKFNSTLTPELTTKKDISVYIKPICTFKNSTEIIDLDKIKDFSKIETKGVIELVKKFDPQINSFLKTVNNITDRIDDCEADDNCDFVTDPEKLEPLDRVFQDLYYQRAEKLRGLNSVSSGFLENLNKYLYKDLFPQIKKEIFDVYSK